MTKRRRNSVSLGETLSLFWTLAPLFVLATIAVIVAWFWPASPDKGHPDYDLLASMICERGCTLDLSKLEQTRFRNALEVCIFGGYDDPSEHYELGFFDKLRLAPKVDDLVGGVGEHQSLFAFAMPDGTHKFVLLQQRYSNTADGEPHCETLNS